MMDSSGRCPHFFNNCGESMQSKLDSPMPVIGMYIAVASAIISIAMAVDVYYGFKYKKWWLPSKYFSLNAFTLTILAVSMKLPVDLTNQMLGVNEILARVSSLALMSTVVGNLMTSLGVMEFNDMLLNIVALATLVITIMVNVFIHISKMVDSAKKEFRHSIIAEIYVEQIICSGFMFILLVMLSYWGISVPSLRRFVDQEHNRLNEKDSTKQVKWGDFTIDGLKVVLRDYWVNAKIVNPQLLIARSEICAASGFICLLTGLTLLEAWLRMHLWYNAGVKVDASNYKWSINYILVIQTIGVGFGTVAPMFRWFLAAKFKSSKFRYYTFQLLFEPTLWGARDLAEWAFAHPSPTIQNFLLRGLVRTAKILVLLFCLIVLMVIVPVSRLLLFVSAVFVKIICLPCPCDQSIIEIRSAWIALFVKGATRGSVQSICSEVDKLMEIPEKKKPENLIKLLNKSGGFNGVSEFVEQPISGPDDALNCWSLSLVILTSIAIQLYNIPRAKVEELQRGVSEGLGFVKLIEKSLNVNLERYRYSHEADDFWSEVRLFGTCQRIDIRRDTPADTLKALRELAGSVSNDESRSVSNDESRPESGFMYCLKMTIRGALGVITVPSDESRPESDFMYSQKMATRSIGYISTAIVQYITDDSEKAQTDLFERISVIISDILSACLTNLVPLITFMCTNGAIKEREENVQEAAIIFGQTREILETLRGRRLPGLDPEKAAYLHGWRAFMEQDPNRMEQDIENPAASATIPQSNEEE